MVITENRMVFLYDRDRVAWWLCSPGKNENEAAFVNGDNGNVNDNGNNVKNTLGVRPALPGRPKCMEGSMRQCIGQRNPVPFLRKSPQEKHMLSETLDARAFKALGVGMPHSPGSQLEEDEYREVMTDETENETVARHPAHPCNGGRIDAGDEFDGVFG